MASLLQKAVARKNRFERPSLSSLLICECVRQQSNGLDVASRPALVRHEDGRCAGSLQVRWWRKRFRFDIDGRGCAGWRKAVGASRHPASDLEVEQGTGILQP